VQALFGRKRPIPLPQTITIARLKLAENRGEGRVLEEHRATDMAAQHRDRSVAGRVHNIDLGDLLLHGARHTAGAQTMRPKITV
jgi:hypothetical protein